MKNDTLQCQGHETKPVNGGVAQWIANMTCKRSVVSLNPIKGSRCFIK